MRLGGGQEGQVVAAVGDDGRGLGRNQPHPHHGDVGGHEQRANEGWQDVGQDVLHRVGVEGQDANGGGPLMVLLVVALVEARVVQQPGQNISYRKIPHTYSSYAQPALLC